MVLIYVGLLTVVVRNWKFREGFPIPRGAVFYTRINVHMENNVWLPWLVWCDCSCKVCHLRMLSFYACHNHFKSSYQIGCHTCLSHHTCYQQSILVWIGVSDNVSRCYVCSYLRDLMMDTVIYVLISCKVVRLIHCSSLISLTLDLSSAASHMLTVKQSYLWSLYCFAVMVHYGRYIRS